MAIPNTDRSEAAGSASRFRALAIALGASAFAWCASCASEEIPTYGDPARVAGGLAATVGPASSSAASGGGEGGEGGGGSGAGAAGAGGTAGAGGAGAGGAGGGCVPGGPCAVSFANDIFAPILDGSAACSAVGCHAAPVLGFQIAPGDPAAAHAMLLSYQLAAKDPYVVPCDPAASKMLCNLKLDPAAGANPHGVCGSLMPKVIEDAVQDQPITTEQLDTIAEWIACGAPNN